MTGVVDVGGGLRAIYGVGVFDYCMDQGIAFDYCAGVSAGSANLASYLAGQRGRNYRFYTDYAFRREYMSLHNYLHSGSYIDLDYVYSVLSNAGGEDPLDYAHLAKAPTPFTVVATDAVTGKAHYFSKSDMTQDRYDVFKASSALPVFCRPYRIGEGVYYDGGISDPIPFEKAFADGCDRVVVVLTRPADFRRDGRKDARLSRLLHRKYPAAGEALRLRFRTYNNAMDRLEQAAAAGRVLVIAPDDCCGMDTLTKNRENMDRLYQKGYADGAKISAWLKE